MAGLPLNFLPYVPNIRSWILSEAQDILPVYAVEIFRNHPEGTFDVILMDIMMPEMNGYEAAKAIRAMNDRPDGKNIPIIAMTANSFAEDVQASLDAGMNVHLSKPIVIEEVIKTILRYVHND